MKTRKVLRRILTVVFALGLIPAALTLGLFQDRAFQENNTFATGSVALKLFYDCAGDGRAVGLDEVIYTDGLLLSGETGSVVDCTQGGLSGTGERSALFYSDVQDGATYAMSGNVFNYEMAGAAGDWSTTNNWFDALSSTFDHTRIVPGFKTYAGAMPVAGEGDIVSIGNAGSDRLSDVIMSVTYETVDTGEEREPLDGVLPGGEGVDPLTDSDWGTQAATGFDTSLGTVINVVVERVRQSGMALETVYSGTFDGLVAGGPVTIFPASATGLEPDQVTYLRFNWSMDAGVDQSFQNKMFDYQVNFDSV